MQGKRNNRNGAGGQAGKLGLWHYSPPVSEPSPKKNSSRWGQAPRHTISKTMGEVPTMGITGGVPKSLSP